MFKRILISLFFIQIVALNAQEEASIWYFGQNAGLDFRSGTPVPLADGALVTDEGCATISDSNGNLLFYTDGVTVWNRNHDPMPNGTGLNGDPSSTQSAIIVPKSDEPNIFFVFTVTDEQSPEGLQYSVLDMDLDGGLGDITDQKNIFLYGPMTEKITAVENANGNGIWVISKAFGSDAFLSYLVDANGVNPAPVVSNVGFTASTHYLEGLGYLKASSNGEFLATASHDDGVVELFHFDTTTGMVTDPISLHDFFDDTFFTRRAYGVEFATNNQLLYISTFGGVYQFDISTYDQAAILASGILVSPSYTLPPYPGGMQMGIDGKIYVTRYYRDYLMVINNPNVPGLGCNFVENGLALAPGTRGILGLPPFITSYFAVGIQAEHFCLGSGTDFSVNVAEPITGISWDFGDGNTSTLETPSHTYASSGTYTVNVTVSTATESSSDTKEITIYETPTANLATDFEICTVNATYEFDLSTKDSEVLGAQNSTDFQVGYFASLTDAVNNVNALSNLYTNTLAVETLYARIHNVNNTECFDTTDFDLVVQQAPTINAQDDWTVCDVDMDGFYDFDLSQKTSGILENNDPADFSVSYYLTQTDLDTKTNAIALNYTNTIAREEIFWRIENNTYPNCYGEGTFFLEVISGVKANTPSNFDVCDDDNDGVFTFDLTLKEPEILGTQNAASTAITFHSSLADAENNIDPLNKGNYTNTTAYNETLFVRIENTADASCYDTTSFEIQITNSPALQTVTDWQVCDTDNDGAFLFDLQTKAAEILGSQSGTEFSVHFYETQTDADTNANAVVGLYGNTGNPQTIFYRIESNGNPDCYVTASFVLEVNRMPVANAPAEIEVCDTDETGLQTFDLSIKDAEVLGGQSTTAYEVSYFTTEADAMAGINPVSKTAYTNTLLQETIYARIQNANHPDCFAISYFDIYIRSLPEPNLEQQYVICPDSPELTIDGGDFESWTWGDADNTTLATDRILNVSALGSYTLTVRDSPSGISCEKTVSFEVVSSGAPEDFTTEIIGFSDQVILEVTALGSGDFEYSVDAANFQASNRLTVFPGTHTVYVRDTFLCRTISKEVIALGYQKFFTPNGDGSHERWHLIGIENFPESKLFIFDRQGKLLKQLDPENPGWDGTFQGVPMPSSDYWFRFENEDGSIFTGHFSLKR